MTVRELLDMLRDYPPDMHVQLGISYGEATLEIGGTMRKIGLRHDRVLILDRSSAIGPPPAIPKGPES